MVQNRGKHSQTLAKKCANKSNDSEIKNLCALLKSSFSSKLKSKSMSRLETFVGNPSIVANWSEISSKRSRITRDDISIGHYKRQFSNDCGKSVFNWKIINEAASKTSLASSFEVEN